MPILVAQVPVSAVAINETAFPDRDESHILEHLVRYFARLDLFPAITVSVNLEGATVVRGHKYLVAARILSRPTIRAVIISPPASDEVKTFLARPDVAPLDWEAIKKQEDLNQKPRLWHVFFFKRALTSVQKAIFDSEARRLFAEPTIQVLHDDVGAVAEFEVVTPMTDTTWAAAHYEAMARFHREQVPIVSYQGQRFAG